MVTVRVEVTAKVVIANVAVDSPAGTVMEAGTRATDVRLLDNVTIIPPAGAGPFKATVPVDGVPPVTVLGFKVSAEATGAVIVKVADRVTLPNVA